MLERCLEFARLVLLSELCNRLVKICVVKSRESECVVKEDLTVLESLVRASSSTQLLRVHYEFGSAKLLLEEIVVFVALIILVQERSSPVGNWLQSRKESEGVCVCAPWLIEDFAQDWTPNLVITCVVLVVYVCYVCPVCGA